MARAFNVASLACGVAQKEITLSSTDNFWYTLPAVRDAQFAEIRASAFDERVYRRFTVDQ